MKRNSAGLRMLHLLLVEGSWDIISNIQTSDFTEDARVVFQYIRNHYDTYNEFPIPAIVQEECGVTLPELGSKEFVIESFRKFVLGNRLQTKIQLAISHLQENDPEAALSAISQIEAPRNLKVKSMRETGKQRWQDYLNRKLKGVSGIQMPWPSLEEVYGRWENGTFSTILGLANSGKSWLSCLCAKHARSFGHKVLVVSMENPVPSFERRIDALVYKIAFDDIRNGTIDFRREQAWHNQLEQDQTGDGDILLVGGSDVRQVEDILNIVSVEKPNLVIVDGAYKLCDQSADGGWAETKKVVNGLQAGANKTNIPWIATSQLNPAKKKTLTGYEMGFDARYGKEFMIDPDNVIAIVQDEDDRMFNRASIKICKVRDVGEIPGNMDFKINTNRETMDFSEIVEDVELAIEY